MVAYARRLSRQRYPGFDAQTETAARICARYCVGCHVIDGDGGKDGPELSHIGSRLDSGALRRLIADPTSVKSDAEMPKFAKRLTPEELEAISSYLAARK